MRRRFGNLYVILVQLVQLTLLSDLRLHLLSDFVFQREGRRQVFLKSRCSNYQACSLNALCRNHMSGGEVVDHPVEISFTDFVTLLPRPILFIATSLQCRRHGTARGSEIFFIMYCKVSSVASSYPLASPLSSSSTLNSDSESSASPL